MNVLVGITSYTANKSYVFPKLEEMLEACVVPVVGRDNIIVVGDTPICGDFPFYPMPLPGHYAEDMLMASRQKMLEFAIAHDYDKLVWQGVDALFQNKEDFERLVSYPSSFDLIAPLISARADASHAICRRFLSLLEGDQVDVPEEELHSGELILTGFPGADNIVLNKQVFEVPFTEDHDPWYERVAEGRTNVCVEEEFVRRCLLLGHHCWCDTALKVFHVHEDGIARMWPGIERPMAELSW
jgi:hypothetical protein